VARIDRRLRQIRAELAAYDQYKKLPFELDLSKDSIPPHLSRLFDDALEAAVGGKYQKSLAICQAIEKAFSYPDPDEIVRHAQIPGGMYTNMMAQLKEAKLEHHLNELLHLVPRVRLDAGLPPLVTPTSQIVGVQAVNCIISLHQGKDMYENVSKNFAELILGSYGKTPWPVDPEFRYKICGTREEKPYDTSQYKPQDNPTVPEAGGTPLALNEKEQLLLELFPSVATKFLRARRIEAWKKAHPEAMSPQPSTEAMAAQSSPYEASDYEPSDGEPPSFWEKAPGWAGWTDTIDDAAQGTAGAAS
jgi:pyruvate/oxaloacetate carboxyltransferase